MAEVRLARRVLGEVDVPVSTVFLGGGTPTLLPPADLGRILAAVDTELGLAPGAEVTTESNPDSVTREDLERLREAGYNRISFGMQSAVPHVLATLDRTHDPERVPHVVAWARAAGFEQVSLDLIYGTPGESLADWDDLGDGRARCRPGPRVGVRPDRRGRHGAGPAGAARRAAGARRRRPRRQVPARRRTPHQCRARLVRSLQLGARRGEPLSPQRPLLDRRRLVGSRARRALPRGRGALVERQAPRGVRPAPCRRTLARRTPARCSTPRRGGSSGSCWRSG